MHDDDRIAVAASRALVVGGGSIGMRHQTVLRGLELDVALVSRRTGVGDFTDEMKAISVHDPDYVVVATEAHDHPEALKRLTSAGYRGSVLVEKPVADRPIALQVDGFRRVGVGYNLRFHPAVDLLRQALAKETVLSAQVRVGQLP